MNPNPYQPPGSDVLVPLRCHYARLGLAWAGVVSIPVALYTAMLIWNVYQSENPHRFKVMPFQLLHLIYCIPFFISAWLWGRRLMRNASFPVARGIFSDLLLVGSIWIPLRLYISHLVGSSPDRMQSTLIRISVGVGICLLIGLLLRRDQLRDTLGRQL